SIICISCGRHYSAIIHFFCKTLPDLFLDVFQRSFSNPAYFQTFSEHVPDITQKFFRRLQAIICPRNLLQKFSNSSSNNNNKSDSNNNNNSGSSNNSNNNSGSNNNSSSSNNNSNCIKSIGVCFDILRATNLAIQGSNHTAVDRIRIYISWEDEHQVEPDLGTDNSNNDCATWCWQPAYFRMSQLTFSMSQTVCDGRL
ncbi:hypothetical protein Ahia01_000350600, partial [Argonauta hians]